MLADKSEGTKGERFVFFGTNEKLKQETAGSAKMGLQQEQRKNQHLVP